MIVEVSWSFHNFSKNHLYALLVISVTKQLRSVWNVLHGIFQLNCGEFLLTYASIANRC